jgi:drug/metabolite transporter (DMT)-like permease
MAVEVTVPVIVAFLAVSFAWGLVFLIQAKLLVDVPPLTLAWTRVTFGACFLLACLAAQCVAKPDVRAAVRAVVGARARATGVTKRFVFKSILMSLCMDIGGNMVVLLAQSRIPSVGTAECSFL